MTAPFLHGSRMISFIFLFSLLITKTINQPLGCSVVIDAGSTGTRVFVYGWKSNIELSTVQILSTKKNHIPITTISEQTDAYDLFTPLIQHANVTTSNHCDSNYNISIYIKATAGMRLLSEPEQTQILSLISAAMKNETFNSFIFKNGFASVISGEEEGLFEWLSINYMNNKSINVNKKNSINSLGVITSGGASVQLSLRASDDIKVYSKSYLGLGHREMQNKVSKLFYDNAISHNQSKIFNPCLSQGHHAEHYISEGKSIEEFGTGTLLKCKDSIKEVFHLNGINVIQPSFPPFMTFYATQYLSNWIYHLNVTTNIDLYNLSEIVFDSCTEKYADHCFDAIYSLYLLSDIFKFPEINSSIIFEEHYSWTLGFLLSNMNFETDEAVNIGNSISPLRPTINLYHPTSYPTNVPSAEETVADIFSGILEKKERDFVSKHGIVDDLILINEYKQSRNLPNNVVLENTMQEYKSLTMLNRMNKVFSKQINHTTLTNYDVLLTLQTNGFSPYIKGGLVRDLYLGIDAYDVDVEVFTNISILNKTINKLGWKHQTIKSWLVLLTDMKIDMAISHSVSDSSLGNEYDPNLALWNFENKTLLISNTSMYALNNRIISAKSYDPEYHEWCFQTPHNFSSECLWKTLRAWKLRIAPKFFKWDYYLWHWIKSTLITEFIYATNESLISKHEHSIKRFFGNHHLGKRGDLMLYQMKLDLGEKLFEMFIPYSVLKYHEHKLNALEINDPNKWEMKCNENLLICDIEIVEIVENDNILFRLDPTKFNNITPNTMILICIGCFIIGIVFIIVIIYSHKCFSCCKKYGEEIHETVGGEGIELELNSESDIESESEIDINISDNEPEINTEVEVTYKYIIILFLNTIAIYSLHRFIGKYSIFFAQQFGITFIEVGYLQTALYLGHIMSVFIPSILQSKCISKYISHLSYKILFFAIKIGLGLLTLAYIFYHPFWFLFLTRFLFGLIYCLYGVYRATFIASNEKQINKQLWIFSFFSLNKSIGLLLLSTFGVFTVYLTSQMALLILTGPCFLLSVLFLIYFPKDNIQTNETIPLIPSKMSNNINVTYDTYPYMFGNLGQIGLILTCGFGGMMNEMFNICLSAWYHDVFHLNASQFWVIIIICALSRAVTFVLITFISKIRKYYCNYNNENINGTLYFMTFSRLIQFGNFLFLYVLITYYQINYTTSLMCVSIFNMCSCANGICSNILSVNLVSNKSDKSKLNAGMKSSHAFGLLLGSFLGPFLFTMNNFQTVMFVVNIASFGTLLAILLIITHYFVIH